jgi:hypothetical protein
VKFEHKTANDFSDIQSVCGAPSPETLLSNAERYNLWCPYLL